MEHLNQYHELLSRFEEAVHRFNMTVHALVVPDDENQLDARVKTEAILNQVKEYEKIISELKQGLIELNTK